MRGHLRHGATVGSGPPNVNRDARGNHTTYDRAGRLLEVAHVTASATLSRFTYGLAAAGRRTSLTTRRGTGKSAVGIVSVGCETDPHTERSYMAVV